MPTIPCNRLDDEDFIDGLLEEEHRRRRGSAGARHTEKRKTDKETHDKDSKRKRGKDSADWVN